MSVSLPYIYQRKDEGDCLHFILCLTYIPGSLLVNVNLSPGNAGLADCTLLVFEGTVIGAQLAECWKILGFDYNILVTWQSCRRPFSGL